MRRGKLLCALVLSAVILVFVLVPVRDAKADESTKLMRAVQNAKGSYDIPMEWPASWPVPTGGKKGAEFKIFFYPIPGRKVPDAEFRIYAPQAEATLDIRDGSVTRHGRYGGPKKEISSKRWPDELSNISMEEFEKLEDRLYKATEEVAVIYAAGRRPTPAEGRRIQTYGKLFLKMCEPALRPYYYALNPDFFDWLGKCGAPTIGR
ncbi:MAG: hypothetical protein ABSE25_08290 [Syntrophorhabdales bacterium]|jgi:hypothetical protein